MDTCQSLYMCSVMIAGYFAIVILLNFVMPRLNMDQRNQAIGMLTAGMSVRHVARNMNCHWSTIIDLRNRYRQQGNVSDRPRSGRPRVTTPNQDRYIQLTHARDRFLPATATARQTVGNHNRPINEHTVRRRLHAYGMRSRRPYVGNILTRRHKQARLAWANAHLRWPRQQWATVLFTDESKFNLSYADGRARVYRRPRERYAQCCVVEVNRFGGGGVMVWAGISRDFKTDLHIVQGRLNARNNRDNILQPIAVPFIRNNGLALLQQDNARPHTARITMDFLRQQGVNVLPWPAYSTDLNPLEHLWDELGRRVHARPVQPQTIRQLEIALRQEWAGIPQNTVRRYVLSMRRRCEAVTGALGGHTRY